MKIFLISLVSLMSFPTALNAASMAKQKGYAAGAIGTNLCYLRKGMISKETFVLSVENLMLRRGYDTDLLYKGNIKKAGRLIADKLGNNCNNQKIYDDKNFSEKILKILKVN